jgi:glycosyltransferase involved in cell wall biosynthesis
MILGIDASNLRSGGTVAHLSELLNAIEPPLIGFSKIILWAEKSMLDKIQDRPWLIKIHEPLLDKGLLHRLYWQAFKVSNLARISGCNLLLVPSGIILGNFKPVAAMSHNLLPFQWSEIRRYGISWQMLRNILLHLIQSSSFKKADGVLFTSNFAKKTIKKFAQKNMIVPPGIHRNFLTAPRAQLPIESYTFEKPFRILYVSTIDMYKHQWIVAEAVARIRSSGLPVELELAGSAYPPALELLENTMKRVDPLNEFIKYLGIVPHLELPNVYARSDLFLFASSCENMPNILLEGMASGLPIASSNRGPMPDVLGDAGIYFNPENSVEIEEASLKLINSPELREKLSNMSYKLVQEYSWKKCADDTLSFLSKLIS